MPRVSEDSILTMKAHGLKKGLWFFIPLLVIGVFGHNMQYKYDNVHNCMCSHPGVMSYSVCLGKRLSHFEITPRNFRQDLNAADVCESLLSGLRREKRSLRSTRTCKTAYQEAV